MDRDNRDNRDSRDSRDTRDFRDNRDGPRDAKSSSREEFEMKDSDGSGKDGGGKGGRTFGRRKPCPFIADKSLVLDYKNLKVLQRFTSEGGKIVPRYISGVSAKNQRKLTKMIKRARNVGFIAPLNEPQV